MNAKDLILEAEEDASGEEDIDPKEYALKSVTLTNAAYVIRNRGHAEKIIRHYMGIVGGDIEDAVADLVSDLGHFCDANGMNIQDEADRGIRNYEYEANAAAHSPDEPVG